MQRNIKTPPKGMVLVEWVDANSDPCWVTPEKVPHIETCFAVGWLIRQDKREIILAANYNPGSETPYGDCIAIPAGWVQKVRKLK